MRLIDLREESLDVAEVVAALDHDAAGGLNLFVGTVRDHDKGREVTHLDYSAHPTAAAEMRAVADEVAAEFDVLALAAVHRTGRLAIGEAAVVVACVSRAPRPGVRRQPRADRPAEVAGADLEAPGVRGRVGRVGWYAVGRGGGAVLGLGPSNSQGL